MVYKSGQIFLPFCHNTRVWQTDRRTDGQTDRIPIARPRLHSCSAVKTSRRQIKQTKNANNVSKLCIRYRPIRTFVCNSQLSQFILMLADTGNSLSVSRKTGYSSVHTAGGTYDRRWRKARRINGLVYLGLTPAFSTPAI